MKQFPPLPVIDDDAAPTFEGHLWLLEVVEGTPLRFQLQQSGAIRFGGAHGTWADDAIPRPCRRAVRHVRERLDRRALRRAVDDVTALTFLGRATHRERIDYDWERLPPFLGRTCGRATPTRFARHRRARPSTTGSVSTRTTRSHRRSRAATSTRLRTTVRRQRGTTAQWRR
ncbi:hypothetical protein [Halolamina pelagica]|uniref:hypothetical protein n=1 Tax=Halolamina pelagica TaxID=699431 RepID=UPI001EFA3C28|nr:hypothetical protein [Halolamina pelagica]